MKNLIKKIFGIKSEKEMNMISFRKSIEVLSTSIHSDRQYNAYMETMLLLCNNIDYREIAADKTAQIDIKNKEIIELKSLCIEYEYLKETINKKDLEIDRLNQVISQFENKENN